MNFFLLSLAGLISLISSFPTAFAEEKDKEKEITIEEFLQGKSTIPGVVYRKDPFLEGPPPFEIPVISANNPNPDDQERPDAPVLERYPVVAYEVIAVLLGDQYPRALVRLPAKEKHKAVIVKEKDKLGSRKGVVIKISASGIVVKQTVKSKFGFVDTAEIELKVGGTSEEQNKAMTEGTAVLNPNAPKGPQKK